jgi:hypothetical protein
MKIALCLLASLVLIINTIYADDDKFIKKGFFDFNYYPYLEDVKSDNSLTINVGAQLGYGFSYFSLTNWGDKDGTNVGRDFDRVFTEQNLRYSFSEDLPIDATVQWNLRTGVENDRLRLGFRWRLSDTDALKAFFQKMHLSYSANFHLKQWDHQQEDQWQVEHVYRLKVLPETFEERVYLAGFADQMFGETGGVQWVSEHQLGVRVVDQWHLVSEYRINTFRAGDENNLAIGLEYLFKF